MENLDVQNSGKEYVHARQIGTIEVLLAARCRTPDGSADPRDTCLTSSGYSPSLQA
jgi:hypothetical protein